jgi:NADPH:quinone reductase-like Zn-dependent oxidoreductase
LAHADRATAAAGGTPWAEMGANIGERIESGRFSLPAAQTFPLAAVAEAHRVGEQGHVRGKLVLLVG